MRAVLRHELNLSFHGMAAYVFGAFLLEMVGIGAMMYNIVVVKRFCNIYG